MRFVAIHGHFYQPARESPWTGKLDREQSAAPYHDWNERVAAECYTPNAQAGLFGPDRRVLAQTNNYERISFDFGPTLLAWLEHKAPATYRAVLTADRIGRKRCSGHGPAVCQMYNHTVAPLDTDRDQRTQAVWAIRDFEHRFGRRPEGIWLAETAVDLRTLDILAELGIGFTILAPHQVRSVRPVGCEPWQDVNASTINTGLAYLLRLASGRSINLFFYDGAIAHEVAFGSLLQDGRAFADRLAGNLGSGVRGPGPESRVPEPGPLLSLVATDGETYGHHHRFGEMALAACLARLQSQGARLAVPAEYLDLSPPRYEALIHENTSWSCPHGVERWRADCGCSTGAHPGWSQAWRQPLREAMDWLRDRLAETYEREAGRLLHDPWEAHDDYISVLLDRSRLGHFLSDHARAPVPSGSVLQPPIPNPQSLLLGLLEMQRFMMLALASDAWFFDDISELTTVQAMRCACRAMELCRELSGPDLEPEYLRILEPARSNVPELGTGRDIWQRLVRRRMA